MQHGAAYSRLVELSTAEHSHQTAFRSILVSEHVSAYAPAPDGPQVARRVHLTHLRRGISIQG
eukprot:15438413-Alexandrium_andersonii.AAC.1